MNEPVWSRVDDYLAGLLAPHDPALDAVLARSEAADLPRIAVSPMQGKLLQVLVRASGARRVLEIGALGGYSTLWMARALAPGGKIISLEANPMHAEVARANLDQAGAGASVEIIEGKATESLPQLAERGEAPFDFVFVDADKESIPTYFDWAVRLSRPGAMIMVDNVVRDGEVVDPESPDTRVQACRRMNELLAEDSRVVGSVVQTIGSKGHDGFLLATVVG